MGLRSFFLYPDENTVTVSVLSRNLYLLLGGVLYSFLLVSNVMAGTLLETAQNVPWWMPYYIYMIYLPVLILYWTPVFQQKIIGSLRKLWCWVFFGVVLIPVVGSLPLLGYIIISSESKKRTAGLQDGKHSAEKGLRNTQMQLILPFLVLGFVQGITVYVLGLEGLLWRLPLPLLILLIPVYIQEVNTIETEKEVREAYSDIRNGEGPMTYVYKAFGGTVTISSTDTAVIEMPRTTLTKHFGTTTLKIEMTESQENEYIKETIYKNGATFGTAKTTFTEQNETTTIKTTFTSTRRLLFTAVVGYFLKDHITSLLEQKGYDLKTINYNIFFLQKPEDLSRN